MGKTNDVNYHRDLRFIRWLTVQIAAVTSENKQVSNDADGCDMRLTPPQSSLSESSQLKLQFQKFYFCHCI